MATYPFQQIEQKWQSFWADQQTFRTPENVDRSKPKFYVLDMFPYPSGIGLHVGHPLGYIATDILARYKRMRGFNVLHPMGFDAFGLPAEQFAVEHGVHPRVTTEKNINNMLRQLKSLGLSYDWQRQLATTDKDYYRWTQWIFLQLFNSYCDEASGTARPIAELSEQFANGTRATPNGQPWANMNDTERDALLAHYRLAYLDEVPVNWCPALGTVLANEEVTNDGRSERGNHPVYKRPLKQWMLRITAFADRLADDLELVDWPQAVKRLQRNWIGRSEGAHIDFALDDNNTNTNTNNVLRVFTTRPDTLFGATYMVLAPEHPLVEQLTSTEQRDAVEAYRRQTAERSDIDRMADEKQKTGVFTGAYAINPVNSEKLPVWIADYVLMGYGTGAIMAVPGQDERDWAFAEAYHLPIIRTVQPSADFDGKAYTGDGEAINSGFLNGLTIAAAKTKIIDWLEQRGVGERKINYKLRDWLFSRQRYWGEPFPILHGPDGRVVAVDESELPVELPPMDDFKPEILDDESAGSVPRPPLARADDSWRIVERNGVRYQRELNTMPQWAGSCWYYLRFIDNNNDQQLIDPELERYWMGDNGVDLYVGGVEHAVLHLLYARFWHKVLFDLGHISTPEPFGKLFNQGYIQAYYYQRDNGARVPADEVVNQDGKPAAAVQGSDGQQFFYAGEPVGERYGKMGKSLKNAVNPDDVCVTYGCDTLRLYEMSLGPLDMSKPWNTRDIVGVNRFLRRAWRCFVADDNTNTLRVSDTEPTEEQLQLLHRTIKRVSDDMERMSYNTAISALIEMINALTSLDALPRALAEPFALLLAPLAPHIAEELWQKLGYDQSLAYQPWPSYDEAYLQTDDITIAVQVMGKLRATVNVPAAASKDEILAAARSHTKIAQLLADKTVRKEIYVPGRLVNFVAN